MISSRGAAREWAFEGKGFSVTVQGANGFAGKPRVLVLAGAVIVVGGAALLAAVLLLPWFNLEDTAMTQLHISIGGSHPAHDTVSILELKSTTPFGYALLACGALAIGAVALRLVRPSVPTIWVGLAVIALGAIGLGADLYSLASPPHVNYGGVTVTNAPVVVTSGIGSLLGLVAAIAIAAGGVLAIVSGRRTEKVVVAAP
jgi:hypothetical protein